MGLSNPVPVIGTVTLMTWSFIMIWGSINMGFSSAGGLVPLGDAFASGEEGELRPLAGIVAKEVNIINGDDGTEAHRKEPGCVG
jgi:hypothetical protein